MKRLSSLLPAILLVVLSVLSVANATAQIEAAIRAFDEGNAHLTDGEFRAAIDSYHQAETGGFVSSALYHNLGLAYFRMDELGLSILYLERAHRMDRDSAVITHSLSVATAHRQDQLSQIGIPFTKRAHQWLVQHISPRGLLLSGVIAYLVFMGLLLSRYLLLVDGPWWRRARFWLGFAAVGILLLAFYSSVRPAFDPAAVVIVDEAVIREQPVESSEEITTVHEGLVVTDISGADGWRLVQLPNGTRGWIDASTLESI